MCKVLRIALPVFVAGVLALALGITPAQATCPFDALVTQGAQGGSMDPVTCGTAPSSVFWLIGFGNQNDHFCTGAPSTSCVFDTDCAGTGPCVALGIDNGGSTGFSDPIEGDGRYWNANWGNAGIDGCVVDQLQTDGTVGPMAAIVNNGAGEGTPQHAGSYVVLSADLDEIFQFYNLDIITTTQVTCQPVPVPVIDTFAPGAGGTFNVTMHWGNVTNLLDDCATNPAILPVDCVGGSRNLQTGWAVYSKSADCAIGTTSGDRKAWTLAASLPVGANASSVVNVPAPASGQCRFVAVNPVFESGFQGQFLSGQAGPIGGSGDQDGDGRPDLIDNCPTVANPAQADGDGDNIGDACDNCPAAANQNQVNADGDAFGDVCDSCPNDATNDADNDGICGSADNCPNAANPSQSDGDGDGIGDACDACPLDPLNDADLDGFCANLDNCPVDANTNQSDKDADGKGDVCDPCPFEKFDDIDTDGKCACDVALGNAGICGTYPNITDGHGNPADNCAILFNPTQTASGFGDGLGSTCEDTFGATEVFWTSFWGPCTVRFKTNQEWNCPKFRVKNLGATKATFPCAECTNGRGQLASYYGGDAGVSIGKCLAGFLVWVEASRTNPNDCAGFVVPKQATKKFPYKVGTRIHLP